MNCLRKNLDRRVHLIAAVSWLLNSRAAIAGAFIGLLLVFYNSRNINFIGVRSYFNDLFTHFHDFLKSNWSSDFGHAETVNGAKKRVVLRREFFSL